ncbi:MAG: cupredoxin domain-containing protein [Syntrophobacteria bacterium]
MKMTYFYKLLVMMVLTLTLVGCAGKGTVLEVPVGMGEATVSMKASSFAFDPAVIKANQGDILILKVENIANIEHNLTIKNPEGAILHSVTLPAGKTVTVSVSLSEVGVYSYYCDHPMHTTLGMSGRIEVKPKK